MAGEQRFGNIDIDHLPAPRAVDMIVTLDPGVVPAGAVGEGQLLNQPVLSQNVERSIDRAVGDAWILATNTLENLTSGEMLMRIDDLVEDHLALRRLPKPPRFGLCQ